MNIGLLISQGRNPLRLTDSLESKIRKAETGYRRKYGRQSDTVHINPAVFRDSGIEQVGKIRVIPSQYISPGDLWIGVEEDA